MATASRPPRRKVAADPLDQSGRETFIALLLLATIIFLLTDSVPIGIAVLVGGGLVAMVRSSA
mgnify:CR=1 FL=1